MGDQRCSPTCAQRIHLNAPRSTLFLFGQLLATICHLFDDSDIGHFLVFSLPILFSLPIANLGEGLRTCRFFY